MVLRVALICYFDKKEMSFGEIAGCYLPPVFIYGEMVDMMHRLN